ncbi:hypothetical protein C8Q74DRAFT_1372865 [Fomes fomentarius]|nr:hypothetical protein C8Q74DRAFT_1372865 [Fomes fomentarius]
MLHQSGVSEQRLTTFTETLRQQRPQGQFILPTPVRPPTRTRVGCIGADEYRIAVRFLPRWSSRGSNDCDTLLNTGGSSVFGIQQSGIDLQKLVIGKPGGEGDSINGGLIDPTTLGGCIQQAVAKGWNAGVMSFQFPNANSQWIQAVKGTSFFA